MKKDDQRHPLETAASMCGRWWRIAVASAAGAAVNCALATSAPAQTAATSNSVGDSQLDEIVVTVERKDESLSKTPETVQVLTAKDLEQQQIVSEADLRAAVPGLSIRAGSNSDQLNYSIRGNSQDAFSGTRPGVLPYINDVQIGGTGGSSAFYDLQSIQVLKGPQGTLFGRSATGGAVLFTTAKPTDQFEGYVSALGGDHGAMKFEGALNTPIAGDAALFRLAGFYQKRDGFQYNLYDDQRIGETKRVGARASLTVNFSPSIQDDLVVDYYHANNQPMEAVLSGLLPLSAPGTPPYIPLTLLYAGTSTPAATATGIATLQALTGAPYAAASAYYNSYFANPLHPTYGLSGVLAAQQARGPYVVDADGSNLFRANNTIITNATTFDLAADTKIKNIFGFTDLRSYTAFETDGSPYAISQTGVIGTPTGYFDEEKQLSDELQFLDTAFNGKLSYVSGLYVSDERLNDANFDEFFDLFFGIQYSPIHFKQDNRTYAGYSQGTYQLNDNGLAFTVGARYTSERVDVTKQPDDADVISLGTPPPAGYSYDEAATFDRVSWQFGLQDQIDPNLLLYAVSRRAYKSGGFVGTSPPKFAFADVAGNEFKAEQVTDAELGAKFQGTVAGMPARLNVALFYQWIDDSQRTAYTLEPTGPAAVTVNVPTEKAPGAELDGQIIPASWLTLGGNINYIHPRFGSTPVDANGSVQIFNQVPDTPELTGIVYAAVSRPITARISGTLRGEVYTQEKDYVSPQSDNNIGTVIGGYSLVNFRLGAQDERAGWNVSANVKNAFNRVYYVGGLPPGQIYQINLLIPGEPRTFTVELRYKF